MKNREGERMTQPKTPAITADVVIPQEDQDEAVKVVLIRRANDPFKGHLALPGGFAEIGESVEHAAVRETREETGLEVELVRLMGDHPGRPIVRSLV